MLRNSLIGAAVFGLSAAAAGYIWSAFEFPFVILVPAVLGWYAVAAWTFSHRDAFRASMVGGITFTAAFMVALFFAISDGSPFAITAWGSAMLAAAVAGAATGWLLDRSHGAAWLAGFSAVGMGIATMLVGLGRTMAPSTVDVPGVTQNAYLGIMLGIVGVVMGLALGAGTAWLAEHRGWNGTTARRMHARSA